MCVGCVECGKAGFCNPSKRIENLCKHSCIRVQSSIYVKAQTYFYVPGRLISKPSKNGEATASFFVPE